MLLLISISTVLFIAKTLILVMLSKVVALQCSCDDVDNSRVLYTNIQIQGAIVLLK